MMLWRLFSKGLELLIIGAVRVYKATLSPLLGNCCRFEPTCSRYCLEAVKVHGPFVGSWLTLGRLLRCRPFGPSGYDPVPPKRRKESKPGVKTDE